jgi:hypothetical protein
VALSGPSEVSRIQWLSWKAIWRTAGAPWMAAKLSPNLQGHGRRVCWVHLAAGVSLLKDAQGEPFV